ncbi:hypothetical protein [Microbacterium resistens]
MPSPQPRARPLWVPVLLGAGTVLVPLLTVSGVDMLREELHLLCSFERMGDEPGSWYCADGIGYILPGLVVAAVVGLPVLAGLLLVLTLTRRRTTALRLLAPLPVLAVTGLTAAMTVSRTDALPHGTTWPGVWWSAVGLAAAIAVGGVLLAAMTVRPMAAGTALTLRIAAGVGLLISVVVQVGLLAAVAASALLLVAAAATTPVRSRPSSSVEWSVSAG